MVLKLKYVILSLALAVAGCAAYFSIWGLSQLFAGASTPVIIMASVLEIGKLVTTTALHTYWDKLAKSLRIYLAISVCVLMLITSAGIYGFLSNAYQTTANKLEIHEGELGLLDAKKGGFEKITTDNQKLIDVKTKRLEQLSNLRSNQESRLDNSGSNRFKNSVRGDIKSADGEIQKLNAEIDILNTKNTVLADSINSYNVKSIQLKSGSSVAAEVGPLKYIAQLTGIPMASVVNYLILLLIFVFDPLAVALILITNRVFQIEGGEEQYIVKEIKNEDKNIAVDNIEVQDKPNFDKSKFKGLRISTREYDDDVLEEPIEYSDDETNEELVFENVLNPIDNIMVDEQTGEILLPKELIEIKREIFFPNPQYDEERDELHGLDLVMNHILSELEEKTVEGVEEVQEPIQIDEEAYSPKGKIMLDDIKEVKERNRGFSVNIPEPKRNNMIQRIGR